VAVGANCTITVTFAPITTGTLNSAIGIYDNAANSPQSITLTGTAVPPVTPAGTYSTYVQASIGSDVHQVPITVVVQ
jgi:hypothetical protein